MNKSKVKEGGGGGAMGPTLSFASCNCFYTNVLGIHLLKVQANRKEEGNSSGVFDLMWTFCT